MKTIMKSLMSKAAPAALLLAGGLRADVTPASAPGASATQPSTQPATQPASPSTQPSTQPIRGDGGAVWGARF